jgi:hypothetical protein
MRIVQWLLSSEQTMTQGCETPLIHASMQSARQSVHAMLSSCTRGPDSPFTVLQGQAVIKLRSSRRACMLYHLTI